MMDFYDDTSPETTAFALKLLIRQDRASSLMPKAARWLAEHRDGVYWFSTKQTSMVIQGLTDYLALSGELANSSDVEVLVNGTSVGKRHFGPDDAFAAPWQIKVPAAQATTGGKVIITKSGNGITYCRKNRISRLIPSPTIWFLSKARFILVTSLRSSWRSTGQHGSICRLRT